MSYWTSFQSNDIELYLFLNDNGRLFQWRKDQTIYELFAKYAPFRTVQIGNSDIVLVTINGDIHVAYFCDSDYVVDENVQIVRREEHHFVWAGSSDGTIYALDDKGDIYDVGECLNDGTQNIKSLPIKNITAAACDGYLLLLDNRGAVYRVTSPVDDEYLVKLMDLPKIIKIVHQYDTSALPDLDGHVHYRNGIDDILSTYNSKTKVSDLVLINHDVISDVFIIDENHQLHRLTYRGCGNDIQQLKNTY